MPLVLSPVSCGREEEYVGGMASEKGIWPGVGYKLIKSLVLEAGSFLQGD